MNSKGIVWLSCLQINGQGIKVRNIKVYLDGAIFVAHCMQFLLIKHIASSKLKIAAIRCVGVATASTFATKLDQFRI